MLIAYVLINFFYRADYLSINPFSVHLLRIIQQIFTSSILSRLDLQHVLYSMILFFS